MALRYRDRNFARTQEAFRHVAATAIAQGAGEFCMRKEALARSFAARASYLPPDPIALEALEARDTTPFSVWQASVERGTATVTTAVQCLTAYLLSLEGLKQDDVQQKVQTDQTGRRLLHWLWSGVDQSDEVKYRRHISDAATHPAFQFELSYFLIEEGNEKYLWDWMQTDAKEYDDPATYTAHLTGLEKENAAGRESKWRGTLLRSMIRARLRQARAYQTWSADLALQDFWTAYDLKARFPVGSVQRRMSLRPAMVELCNNLPTPHYEHTDTAQWDRFRKFVRSYDRLKAQRLKELECARLDLFHPKSPNLQSTLRIVRNPPKQITAVSPSRLDLAFHNHLEFLLRYAKDFAGRRRMIAERDEIEDFYSRLMQAWKPHLWQYRYGSGNDNRIIRRMYAGLQWT